MPFDVKKNSAPLKPRGPGIFSPGGVFLKQPNRNPLGAHGGPHEPEMKSAPLKPRGPGIFSPGGIFLKPPNRYPLSQR